MNLPDAYLKDFDKSVRSNCQEVVGSTVHKSPGNVIYVFRLLDFWHAYSLEGFGLISVEIYENDGIAIFHSLRVLWLLMAAVNFHIFRYFFRGGLKIFASYR